MANQHPEFFPALVFLQADNLKICWPTPQESWAFAWIISPEKNKAGPLPGEVSLGCGAIPVLELHVAGTSPLRRSTMALLGYAYPVNYVFPPGKTW
jgi:hypothetical protein